MPWLGALRDVRVMLRLREAARAEKRTANTLEELQSECGAPFVDQGKDYRGYQEAVALKEGTSPLSAERAYLCAFESFITGKQVAGCGWVKGNPFSQPYDEHGPLAGSAGTRYFCRICTLQIGEDATKHY